MITPDQAESRRERAAIMAADDISEAEIAAYLRTRPDIFGVDDEEMVQEDLTF